MQTPVSGAPASGPAVKNAQAPSAPKVPVKAAAAETESVLETKFFRITFSNRGAIAKSWILKEHKDNAGNPFDVINQTVAAQLGYPLSLFTYDKELERRLNESLYVASAAGDSQPG